MSTILKLHVTKHNPITDAQKISSFILFFPTTDNPKYIKKSKIIKIDLTDLFLYDENLYKNVISNTLTYTNLFYKAFDRIFYDDQEITFDEDNVMLYHRLARLKEKMPNVKPTDVIPGELLRDYEVYFALDDLIIQNTKATISASAMTSSNATTSYNLSNTENASNFLSQNLASNSNFSFFTQMRNLDSSKIGQYVLVRGIVTKTTQTKPSLQLASYICESCASETYQPITKDNFIPILQCTSSKCTIQKVKPTLILKNRASKFTTFQCVTLSENTGDMPKGSVPQNIKLYLYGSVCGEIKPGDSVYVGGVFVPKKLYGLIHDTHILVHQIYNDNGVSIEKTNKDADETKHSTDISETDDTMYPNILNSFAPEIYGLENVKKILLLSLISAPKKENNFMKVRGNINVLLVGDPGTAKSQLLKTVSGLAARSVFTTGKGSSGVGLTASVTRDPLTKEMILEGGALVLSDNGVCCIDELDKMNESDRVSIHEVMEQQSISINKAGINATLNARCSIVGAANPVKGVFRNDRSLEWNLGLPIALLSRFDCVCIIKDEVEAEKDRNLGMHITNNFLFESCGDTEKQKYGNNETEGNNKTEGNSSQINENKNVDTINNIHKHTSETNNCDSYKPLMSYEEIKIFIEKAKFIEPVIPGNLSKILVDAFVEKRKSCKNTTPRYLLSLIRFTLAHARLRLSNVVKRIDVDEAVRLMEDNAFESKPSISESLDQTIYKLIKKYMNNENKLGYEELFELCKEYNKVKVEKVLKNYMDLGALVYDEKMITLIQ